MRSQHLQKFSAEPLQIRFGQFVVLRDAGRIQRIDNEYWMSVAGQMRPVKIAWRDR